MRARSLACSFLWLLTLCVLAMPAMAQENPFTITGSPQKHPGESVLGVDQIDPLSGNLLLAHTDLELPGNAGLDLRVTRYYNSHIYPGFASGSYAFEEPSWVGVGWRLHFGRVIHPDSTVVGDLQIEMPDGSRHPVFRVDANDPWWRSADFFLYNPTTHVLKLPNGLVYTFDHLSASADGGQLGAMRYVTEIRDPFNNTLVFSYFDSPGPTGGVSQIVQDLGNGQVRTVTFGLDDTGHLLGTMTYNGRTWGYQYLESQVPGYVLLEYAQQPRAGTALRRWTYYYGVSVPGEELSLMKAPTGTEFHYTYDTITRTANTTTYPARVVTARGMMGDPGTGTSGGAWYFTYNQGPDLNYTRVDGPTGTSAYGYNGIGTAGPFNVWRTGTLARQSRYYNGVELERHDYSYVQSDPLVMVPVGRQGDPWSDAAVYRSLLGSHTVARDIGQAGEASWTTYFDYHTGDDSFNDYGQPYRIWQWPYYTAREIRRTYRNPNTFTPYIVGRLSEEMTKYSDRLGHYLDTDETWRTFGYDSSTGFLTGSTVDFVTTTYTATPRGNVASVTNANQVPTTFAYAWGAVSREETPLSLTVRTIPGPDPQPTSETVGKAPDTPLTTTFAYDSLGRISQVTPPGSSGGTTPAPSVYSYDDTSEFPTWTSVSRGYANPTVVKTWTDGLGRVWRTETKDTGTTSVRVDVRHDAEGREVFRSVPYAGGTPPERGVWRTYDGLGRVLSERVGLPSAQPTASTENSSLTTYAYSGADTTVTDPKGQITRYHSAFFSGPGDGRLLTVTDAAGQVTQYEYRLTNTLVRAQGPGCAPGDTTCTIGAGPVRTWAYSPTTNRLVQETHPESGAVQYGYDTLGNVTSTTRLVPGGPSEVTSISYDDLNRPLSRTTAGQPFAVAWTYDSLGHTRTVTSDVTTTYAFDAATGRPTSRTDSKPNPNGWTYTSSVAFDDRDQLLSVTYPNPGARVVGYAYDVLGRLSAVTNNGVSFASTFQYDASRLLSYVTGAVTHSVSYDPLDRVAGLGTTGLQGPNLALTYSRDPAGNVTGLVDGGLSQSFSYDALHRLKTATGPWGSLAWEYDPTGNRTKETGGAVTTYQYTATTNRLASLAGTVSESFTYDAFGRLTQDGQATYVYRPDGALVSATRAGMTASYLSTGEGLRVERTVNGQRAVSVRGLNGQVLSEFDGDGCGTGLVWSKDLIYAGSRLLGSVKNATARPTLAFATAASSVAETAGSASVAVLLTTPAPLPCAVTVAYQTSNGTATAGQDYTARSGLLTFPAGSATGATQTITIPVLDDGVYEGSETLAVTLATPIGADLGSPSAHTLTIADSETAPTLSVGDVTVTEAPGATAVFTVSVSTPSATPITVTYGTGNGTAVAGQDYVAVGGTLTIPAQASSATIAVPIVFDPLYEPTETFTLTLSGPSAPVTLARATATATILDAPRVDIDPSLPSLYLAELSADSAVSDYLVVGNPNAVTVPVRLTWVRPDGTDVRREFSLAAGQRVTVWVPGEPGIAGLPSVSLAVQSLDPARPIDAEHSAYWGNWQGGRSTEGVAAAPTWYFAEGATTLFDETLTVFNPTNGPVDVTFDFFGTTGTFGSHTERIGAGPGRFTIPVRNWLGNVDHGTRITGRTLSGELAPIATERVMTWEWVAGQPEGHSTPGVSTLSADWYFAEGDMAYFATYFALLNPGLSEATVRVDYLHANGQAYTEFVVVPAQRRLTVYPGIVPSGSFATHFSLIAGPPIAAERMLYGGPNWTISHAGVGATAPGLTWRFTEGANGTFFETYLLLANPGGTAAATTLTFTKTDGTVVTSTTTVPAWGRTNVWVKSLPGMSSGDFRTTVAVTNGVPIVAERATYWPVGTSASSAALGATLPPGVGGESDATTARGVTLEAATTDRAPVRRTFDPYAATTAHGPGPRLYERLVGYGGRVASTAETPQVAADTGPPVSGAGTRSATPLEGAATQATTTTITWYGAHLTGGRRQ